MQKECKMHEIHVQKAVRNAWNSYAKNSAKCVKSICKKQCKMRGIYVQKTVRNAWNLFAKNSAKCVNFLQILRCLLQINLAHFSVFFAGKLAENWMAILYNFNLFRDDFLCNCVQGWERRDFGQIPVKMRPSRSGLHWKYSFLQRDVNEKRDCESYPRKTVDPSFEPQTTSLMLKMKFLRRSGRKYEKSCSYGHGVSWGLAKVVCWVCRNCEKSQKRCAKMRNIAEKAS